MTSSHNFLSMIFGIFGKFGIEICERKKNRRCFFHRKKNDRTNRKNFGRKKNRSKKKLIEKKSHRTKFRSLFFSTEKYFRPNNFSTEKYFRPKFFRSIFFRPKFFDFVFRSKHFSMKNFRRFFFSFTYSDPNFPKDSKNHS